MNFDRRKDIRPIHVWIVQAVFAVLGVGFGISAVIGQHDAGDASRELCARLGSMLVGFAFGGAALWAVPAVMVGDESRSWRAKVLFIIAAIGLALSSLCG